ncbi:hypothetical protein AAER46_18665, partial [Acinetobacter baumannii]|uniref:hypothetical protein n=1 Tax=Acinetobacter baumannii TaxID=470 RepID=UPI0031F40AB1
YRAIATMKSGGAVIFNFGSAPFKYTKLASLSLIHPGLELGRMADGIHTDEKNELKVACPGETASNVLSEDPVYRTPPEHSDKIC